MAVKLERSSRYWYHTFITSDGVNFLVSSTRIMAEQSPVMRKLIHDASEIKKDKYPPIQLSFCNGSEFEMFKKYVDTSTEKEMQKKIQFDNLVSWFSVANKFQLRELKLYCIHFIASEVHDSTPSLDYVLKLAKIACNNRSRLACTAIFRFYRLYHPDLLLNATYMHQLSEVLPKSALAILSSDVTQFAKWVERFSHDWSSGRCMNDNCFNRILMCRRCDLKFCQKCPTNKYKNDLLYDQCKSNKCHCNFEFCATCEFCCKKWGDCVCKESEIPDIMWKTDFDDI